MENYRITLKKRMRLYGRCCALVNILLLIANRVAASAPEEAHGIHFSHGLVLGAAIAVIGLTIHSIVKIRRALADESLLRTLYIAETDERKLFIIQKIGRPGMLLSTSVLLLAAVIASYFNVTVAYTLALSSMTVSLIMIGLKLYYRNKY